MSIVEKYTAECLAEGFEYLGRGTRKGYSVAKCMVCGTVDDYHQTNVRAGRVRCGACQISKYKSAVKDGWTFDNHFCADRQTFVNIKHECCDDLVKVRAGAYLNGKYTCQKCQITKYKQAAKQDWTFIDHFCDGHRTYVNLKHSCPDTIVKVHVSDFLKGSYDCPNCSHTHFSEPSFFYVIQVGDIIKLGISNRPDERYNQYGLPNDATIIEHLRIQLENKRDALVLESYAKQLVKDFKIPPDIAKRVFTKSGYNECYTIESLDHLLTI